MKHINKTYYWIGLLIFFSIVLGLRYFGILTEIRKEFFYAIFGLWICLILLPLFGEIEFLGIKLKKEIEELKKDVKSEIQSIKYEINTSNKQQVFLGYGPPPSDNKMSELEKEINDLKEKYKVNEKESEKLKSSELTGRFDVSESTVQLFQIRYKLEGLITKIWNNYREDQDSENGRITSPTRMLNDLVNLEIINLDISEIIRGILSICNSAVHGKMTSKRQRDFVLENSKVIYDTLSEKIKNE